ncbi:MAG: PLD nuclease N-terminal domain-containing protein [Candidatus Bipolaricaulota bacterium]|nr:PLD nuclease N-terminal domain-containing protein [Candidatus Bipolaricaulota bacterium]
MDSQLILLLIPLGVIELALAIVALADWVRRKAFRALPRWGWLVAIIVLGIVGPSVYLILGRGEERTEPDGRDSN